MSPNSTQLPFTGSDDLPILALIGAAGVVTGAGVVRAARRRRPLPQRAAV
jgi:LPXTG-motif cell wall-anchored protein